MRMLALAVGLFSVAVAGMAQAAGQGTEAWVKAPPAVLQKATADTIAVPLNVLDGLAASEPAIVVPEGAPRAGMVAMYVLVSKTGVVEEVEASSGDETLRKVAADGVMGWKYRPYLVNGEPREFQVTILIQFRAGLGRRVTAPPSGPAPNMGPVQMIKEDAPPPGVLQGATVDTVTVSQSALRDLALSEPDISARDEAPQPSMVLLRVLVSKTGSVEEAVVVRGQGEMPKVAAAGVMGWTYRPYLADGQPREIQSTILLDFRDGVGKRAVAGMAGLGGGVAGMSRGPASGAGGGGAPNDGMTVSSGIVAGLLDHAVAPVYPAIAKAAHVQGVVVLQAILSETGDIEDLKVISGPPMLTGAAMDAVRQWKYRPYLLNGVPTRMRTTINVNFTFSTPKKPDAAGATGVEGDGLGGGGDGGQSAVPTAVRLFPASGPTAGMLVEAPQPVYPLEAMKAHVQGVVVLHARISKTGDVEDLKVIGGPELLQQAAIDAVQRWKYRPFLLKGEPTAVETTINVNFSFDDPKKPDAAGGATGDSTGTTPPAATPDPK